MKRRAEEKAARRFILFGLPGTKIRKARKLTRLKTKRQIVDRALDLFVGAHGYETYREAARIYRSGRAPGISLTTIDTLNAAIEPEHGASVFTLHRDFSRMARIYKLVLYQF